MPDAPLAALRACGRLAQADLDRFRAHGVPVFTLAGYRRPLAEIEALRGLGLTAAEEAAIDPGFAVAREPVRFLPRRRFAFACDARGEPNDAVPAYVMPEVDEARGIDDLVAWHPRTGRLASWRGRAGLLGGANLDAIPGEPVAVHRDPLGWLRSWRAGVVVVDEALARPRLLEADRLAATDLEHGQALKAMLTRVALPAILVPAEAAAERSAA